MCDIINTIPIDGGNANDSNKKDTQLQGGMKMSFLMRQMHDHCKMLQELVAEKYEKDDDYVIE